MIKRFIPVRGAYYGTTDNRADRWYVNDTESTVIDRRGSGYSTKRECEEACKYLEEEKGR